MKPVFWNVIPALKIKGTIWEKIDDTKVKLDLDTLDDKFSQVKKQPKVVEASASKKSKPTFILPDRTRMINIVLNKLRFQPLDIVDWLEAYNKEKLSQETCTLLLPLMPSEAEISEVAKYNGNPTDLATADQFVLIMAGLIGYKERVQSLIFSYHYKEDFDLVCEEVQHFTEFFKFLKEDNLVRKWLEIILAFGNYINGGSFKGGAYGFRLDILGKLDELKSKDNKTNFADYLVKFVSEKNKGLLQIIEKLEILDSLHYSSIQESAKAFATEFKSVEMLKKVISENKDQLQEEDGSEKFLRFFPDAEAKVKKISEMSAKIDEDFEAIKKFYGEDGKFTIDNLIDILEKFRRQLRAAAEKAQEKKK